ncbi:MAG: hypothetical protein OQK82_07780 [Candidatus Pacearchaeota archaeon]|nr:hypothetical protein [Candidatus Pacearchaeota archaeon]
MIKRFFLVFFFSFLFCLSFVLGVTPFGANITEGVSGSASVDIAQGVAAQAGNVTELNIFGYTVTQSWQGYFGNVSGTIQLSDSADNVMYNWSALSPEGEIYASTSDSVNWGGIECFNFTSEGESLESYFGILSDDVDGVDETFSYSNGHDLFYTNNIAFEEGVCMSTQLYDNSGGGVDDYFEEVLLWDGGDVVFASLLEDDVLGFDGRGHDFEILVLEDGHGDNNEVTDYYFYVELQ